jgi:hypothetical protein
MKMEDVLTSAGATAVSVTSLRDAGHSASKTSAPPPKVLSEAERTVSMG